MSLKSCLVGYRVQKQNMEWFLKLFFFCLITPIFWKKNDKSKFSWLALLFNHFFIKIQPNMSEQEKKQQRIYDLLNAETKPKFLYQSYTKQRKIFSEKELFKEKGEWRSEQKMKRRLFNCSRYGNLEGPHNVNKKAH